MARSYRSITIIAALALSAGLVACTGTKILPGAATQSGTEARIKGDAKLGPLGNAVTQLEQVDGQSLGATESQALVTPGKHTIAVRCSIPARGALSQDNYTFNAEAGHTYRLELKVLPHPPGCATTVLDTDTDIVVAGPGS